MPPLSKRPSKRERSLERIQQLTRDAHREAEEHTIGEDWPAWPDLEALLRIAAQEADRQLERERAPKLDAIDQAEAVPLS